MNVWLLEAPGFFPPYYLARVPRKVGKLREGEELGTYDPNAAAQFSTQADAVMATSGRSERWIAMEHEFI